MGALKQRFMKWSLKRLMRRTRRHLARDPSPLRIRRDMASLDRLLAGRPSYGLSEPVALGACTGLWLDVSGADGGPVILYLHGGAFVAESPGTHCALLARMCRAAGARGFYVNYRLAPEHPYPAATDDCLAAYRYLLAQGIPASRIVIAGDSAGGNLTLVTAMRIRDQELPPPAGLVMMSPVLDLTFSGPSVRRNDGIDPLFRATSVDVLISVYSPGGDPLTPYISPLFGDLTGLPPAFVVVGSSEILLDDSLRFASMGKNVELHVWHDMPHVFPVAGMLDEATDAVRSMAAFIGRQVPATAERASAVCEAG